MSISFMVINPEIPIFSNKVEKEGEEGGIEKSSGIKPGFWDDAAVSNHSPNSLRNAPRSCFAGAAGQDLCGLAPTASSWMKKLGSDELARLSTKCLAPSWSQRGCWASRLDLGLLKNLND